MEQQARFDAFRRSYNEERPHEALEQTTPASHWSRPGRLLPERIDEPWYDADHEVRRVRSEGSIKWRGDLGPPAIVAIAFVEDISGARLDIGFLADLYVVHIGGRDFRAKGPIGARVMDHVHFEAVSAAVGAGVIEEFAQRDGRRIDEADHVRALPARMTVERAGEHGEEIGEDGDGPAGVGVGKGRAREPPRPEVIMRARVGVEGGNEGAQAGDPGKLGVDERDEVIPALEGFVVGVAAMPLDDLLEGAPIDRLEQLGEYSRVHGHVRSFFPVSTTGKYPTTVGKTGHAPATFRLIPRTALREAGEGQGGGLFSD
ncbi:hypothetical protein SS37A_15260 [Methylocystis iwaonis]|uniref:Integrase catalytic domain-containing protein n=1 Tax=Methylocystis iwaonis TaxID=2885079 RepID=A0ABN6VGE2_9HYPH|nr:hypothetical protein SS37A_15260 [Methylocystis iwaonis]